MSPSAATDANPASDPADSCVMVIFGASGDLAKRKLVPALYNLARDKLLAQQFALVGFATRNYTTEAFRKHLDDAMEAQISFAADAVRDEQTKVLNAIQIPSPEEVLAWCVRGQYGQGTVDGQRLLAYRSEANVAPNSSTETFVALRLGLDNWR